MRATAGTRWRLLPARGSLLVSTDLHGNAEDFRRLKGLFEELGPQAHWALLGDLVHGPDARAREEDPERYGFEDRSPELIDAVFELRAQHPERVHLLLGNHDHGHVGGMHTSKFYRDEVAALEGRLTQAQFERCKALFSSALLALAAPCGVLFSHGAPDESLARLEDLDALRFDGAGHTPEQRRLLACVLRAYGQPEERAVAMLDALAASSGLPLRIAVHGHDVDELGYYREGTRQLCPVLFGAPDGAKRYLLLDLAARYEDAFALREGHELRRLYPELSVENP